MSAAQGIERAAPARSVAAASTSASAPAAGAQPQPAPSKRGGRGGHGGPGVAVAATAQRRAGVPADTVLGASTVAILGIMLLPLPAALLDVLLALSVSLSLLVFLISLHIDKPLEFSAFPSLLLLVTLFRLALNIGSTRLILLHGNLGADAAGHVIRAFGQFVVGGNTAVGVIIFLILVVINFVVITKGAGRIAEVAARFTLDSMPGKQMAIDADLAAGLVSESEARARRRTIESEADFFGAMDGASKFVRGDAIAGLIITIINIVGGLLLGMLQHNMGLAQAAAAFTTLTVGDGLVSQVPALLTSIAAGLVTTRAAAGGPLAETVRRQLFGARRPAATAAVVLGALALVPGMPHVAFLVVAGMLGAIAWRVSDASLVPDDAGVAVQPKPEQSEKLEVQALVPVEKLAVEVGYELVPLLEGKAEGSVLGRVVGIRKQLAQELGIVVPPVYMRDNLTLRPGGYRFLVSGAVVAKGELRVGRLLAMDPAGAPLQLSGDSVVEPAFGLEARWIDSRDRGQAESLGYTVVDASTVLATHLGETLGAMAHELLGREQLQELLDVHGPQHARAIEELLPTQISHALFLRTLKELLRERVSIRDFGTILEALGEVCGETKDLESLVEAARRRLGRQITRKHVGADNVLSALVLAPEVESAFRRMRGGAAGAGGAGGAGGAAAVDPNELQHLLHAFERGTTALKGADTLPVIVTAADVRRAVAAFVERHVRGMAVLSYRELDEQVSVRTAGVIGTKALQGAA